MHNWALLWVPSIRNSSWRQAGSHWSGPVKMPPRVIPRLISMTLVRHWPGKWTFGVNFVVESSQQKQRWRHRQTGRTRHDRPAWDLAGSQYGLDVVFFVLGCWLLAATGLHATDWPWPNERPARRSVQRWLRRLAADADTWLQAVRLATIERAAPRPLEEIIPTGGIPPPEGRTRCHRVHADAGKLRSVARILESAAQSLSISIRSLLVAAQRRWTEATLTTGRSALP